MSTSCGLEPELAWGIPWGIRAYFTSPLAFILPRMLLAITLKRTLQLIGLLPHFSGKNQGQFVLTKVEAPYCLKGPRVNQKHKKSSRC